MPKRRKDPREKIIKNYEDKLRVIKRSMDHIKSIPLDEPVQISVSVYRLMDSGWGKSIEKALVIMRGFNAESFKAQLLAFPNAHPFPNRRWNRGVRDPLHLDNEQRTYALRIQAIEAWEPVKKDEFPCFLSSDMHTPAFKRVINGGKL